MIVRGRLLCRYYTTGVLTIVLAASFTFAQVDNFLEEDSSSTEVDQEEPGSEENAKSDESNLDLSILFQKLAELENENRFLVDRIEQLEHEIEQLRRENRERYTELDERVRGLSGQATLEAGGVDGLELDQDTEEGAYQYALVLIQEKKYDDAVSVLQDLLLTYPNGQYIPNVFYYLGELYITKEPKELENARQQFVQLVRLYPKHAKVPEAKYKLGTIYDELEDSTKALEYFDEVVTDHPGTSAARLAKEYATTMREIEAMQESTE